MPGCTQAGYLQYVFIDLFHRYMVHRQLCAHSIKSLSMELQSEDGRGWRGRSAAASVEMGSAGQGCQHCTEERAGTGIPVCPVLGTGRTGMFPPRRVREQRSPDPSSPFVPSVLPGSRVRVRAGLWHSSPWDHPGLKRVGTSEAAFLQLGGPGGCSHGLGGDDDIAIALHPRQLVTLKVHHQLLQPRQPRHQIHPEFGLCLRLQRLLTVGRAGSECGPSPSEPLVTLPGPTVPQDSAGTLASKDLCRVAESFPQGDVG